MGQYLPLLLLSTSCYNGEGHALNESYEGSRTCYEGHARHEEEGCHAGNESHGCYEGHARHEEEGCHAGNESYGCYEGHACHEEEGCHAVNESHEGSCTSHEGHARYEEVGLSKSDSTKNKIKDEGCKFSNAPS